MGQLKKIIQFQGCWFAIVLGQTYGWSYQGYGVAALLFAWALLEDPLWWKELLFSLCLGVFGWCLDSLLMRVPIFLFPYSISPYAPLWIFVLWCSFSLGLEDFYMLWVRRSNGRRLIEDGRFILCVIGAVMGPVSYYACEEFGIVFYSRPFWFYVSLHALLWTFILPLVVGAKFRFKRY